MAYNFESELPEAFGQLLKTEMDYDVIIHIGENPNFKEFHAHSIILRCRSEYFNKIFSTENIEKKKGKYLIKNPKITPQAFDVILKYLYTGQINITNKTGAELLDFMIISDELNLKKLANVTEDFIIKNHRQFLQNDPVGILQIINYCKLLVNLQEFCLDKICSEPEILFNSDKFTQLPAPLLEILLKRDDLNLKEIEIWENLVKWGLAQSQVFDQDVDNWIKDDFNIFKRILYKFIPLIRFYEISSEDYFNKVKPYEKILSKELRNDILRYHMTSRCKPIYTIRRRKSNFESVLINHNHVVLFANWIDRKKENDNKSIPYEFNLLYRASRDGNTGKAFHAKCDNKGATIVIAKTKNSEQIVGGYTPLEWDSSNDHKSTKNSFIFTFTNRTNLQTGSVAYSNGDGNSIICYSDHPPMFGLNNLYLGKCNNWDSKPFMNKINQYSYPKLYDMPCGSFKLDDYEVFQVIRKS
ncbi:hypothetical protein C1645_874890 [Glomus cerebriforme]|uniref:BTB/POZ domain-containing protein n=1 Tax=Glomus cerebriforme TaxID=658196 RepID=A0A397TBH7_9GLOM|nr:hypothetical protein C1645_874890 [Glomus cerebriforme]